MSRENVERLLLAGGKDKDLRAKYNAFETKEEFVASAVQDGYDFTIEELDKVIAEEGDSFESAGNPRTRNIWWR